MQSWAEYGAWEETALVPHGRGAPLSRAMPGVAAKSSAAGTAARKRLERSRNGFVVLIPLKWHAP
jgi:hypothetical protein